MSIENLKISENRKNPDKWFQAIVTLEKAIDMSKKVMRKKHELGLGIWMRYHAVKGTNFKKLSKEEKQKLFNEFSIWYQGAFEKPYRPSNTSIKSRNVSEFIFRMDNSMPNILKKLETE